MKSKMVFRAYNSKSTPRGRDHPSPWTDSLHRAQPQQAQTLEQPQDYPPSHPPSLFSSPSHHVVSFRVHALASNRMKARVSSDHLPANTTNRTRARRPTNSAGPLLALTSSKTSAAPLWSLAPAVPDPSQSGVHCKLGATKTKATTTILRRRPSRGSSAAMSMSRTITLTTTCPPAAIRIEWMATSATH